MASSIGWSKEAVEVAHGQVIPARNAQVPVAILRRLYAGVWNENIKRIVAVRVDPPRLLNSELDAVAVNLARDDAGFYEKGMAIIAAATAKLRYGVFLFRVPRMRLSGEGRCEGCNSYPNRHQC